MTLLQPSWTHRGAAGLQPLARVKRHRCDDPLKAVAETLAHWVDALPGFPRFIYLAVGRGDHRKDSEVDVYSAARRFAIQGRTNMRSLAASAFLLVLLLPASLAAGPPCGVMPVVAREPMSGRSQAQAAKVACLPDACLAQLNTGEPDEIRPVETVQSQAPTRSGVPAAVDGICNALAAAAAENDLPVDFFTRLIWQESRFDPAAVSRAGAQGVAQFMPATASWRGLADPFDPIEAIAKSAKLLHDLRREFGNLGLAAAAYNAGPGRVRDWLAGRRGLPRETRAYVSLVTGQSAEQWTRVQAGPAAMPNAVPCRQIAGLFARPPAPVAKPADPWGVQLVGSSSDATALSAYRQLQEKYASILTGHEPHIVHHGLARGSMGWARVHVGAESRTSAEKLCANLRAAGASCLVQRY
jgi:Transglycosylase SLT domain/SPOR domain